MLRIRLTRTGRKKRPSYRVVVAEAGWARDGRRVAELGYYDPLTEPSTIRLDVAAADDWVRKGAQPSERVQKLMAIARASADSVSEGPEAGSGEEQAKSSAKAESKTKAKGKAKSKAKSKTKAKSKAKASAKSKA